MWGPQESKSSSDFCSAITRIAVAQICQSVGYRAAQTSALDTLSDVAVRYMRAIAKSAAASANSCGRTESKLYDVVVALMDLGSVEGFRGASSVPHYLVSSSYLLKEIINFVSHTDEIPFAQPFPPRKRFLGMRRCGGGEYGVDIWRHVPRWLPKMPVIGGDGREGNGEEEGFGGDGKMIGGKAEGKREMVGKGFELPKKRGKVRFKMGGNWGAEMGIGVSSRGGIGKRVSCQSWNGSEEDGKKRRVVRGPR